MRDEVKRALERQNYQRGHALDGRGAGSTMKAMKCEPCGNAIARALCSICWKPLCRRHSIVVDGAVYCSEHEPGYR